MSTTTNRTTDIEEQITDLLPNTVQVDTVQYEGPEVILYTDTPEKFSNNPELLQQIAFKIKKRITIRPTKRIRKDKQIAKETIQNLVPNQATITNISFHDDTNEVFIEAKRPGMVIGRDGDKIKEITNKTGWNAEILRTPPLKSSTVENARKFLTHNRQERRENLERIGRQIHREKTSSEKFTRVTTLGCCQEVGRAAFVLSTGNTRILVDCGDKPGSENEVPYLQVPEGIAAGAHSIDGVVLTHAHLDHAALLPLLFKYGYDGPVYCTEPTRDLMGLLTLDYLNVAGKQGRQKPYDSKHVRNALKHTITLDYNEVTEIAPDIRLTMKNAGHILGSAVSHFNVNEGEETIVFSGDIHQKPTKLFNGADNSFSNVDSVIMESTYGKNTDIQASQPEAETELKRVIRDRVQSNGKVIIPAFAVGRSQEIMLVLEEAMKNGDIPEVPIYLDGMISEATAIHAAYPEFLRDGVRERIFHENENPFLYNGFTTITGGEKQRQKIADGEQCIVLTTSGMLTGGPVMSWLRLLAPNENSTLVFVGYQAPGTLGKDIQKGEKELQLEDWSQDNVNSTVKVPVNMDVETVTGFSGHADRNGLMTFLTSMQSKPQRVLCVHGDENAVKEFSQSIQREIGVRAHAPKNLETFRFD